MGLRLLHTSDVHLGRAFGYLGERAETHRLRLKQALEKAYRIAQDHECDALIIAGDLFDRPRVELEWVEFALSLIASVSFPTIVIPGNHDPADRHPFAERRSLPHQLRFYPHAKRERLPALDVEIIACPAGEDRRFQTLLKRDPAGAPYQVAVVHGSMPTAGEGTLRREWFRDCQLDYVAIGDWHSPQDFSEIGVACWYSGAPEMIMPNQRLPGVALLVELSDRSRPQITPIQTGSAHFPEGADSSGVVEVNVSGHNSLTSLLETLRPILDETTVARIRLTGRWDSDVPLDLEVLYEALSVQCLWVWMEPAFRSVGLAPQTPFEHALAEVYQECKARMQGDAELLDSAYQQALYLLRGGRL